MPSANLFGKINRYNIKGITYILYTVNAKYLCDNMNVF